MNYVQSVIGLIIIVLTGCGQGLKEINEFTPSGILYKQYFIDSDSLVQGELKVYYDDGEILFEQSNYLDGKLNGERVLYYQNGSPEIMEYYHDGVLSDTLKVFYPSGNIKRKVFYSSGELKGILSGYYEDGTLKETVTFSNNEENGPFVEYFPNGNLAWKGHYLNGEYEFGELLKYDSSGTLIRRLMCDSIARCHTIWVLNEDSDS